MAGDLAGEGLDAALEVVVGEDAAGEADALAASLPSIRRPVMMSSLALARPIKRGSISVTPPPRWVPMETSGKPIWALSFIKMKSAAQEISAPAPSA